MVRSAMAGVSVSVALVSAQIPSFKGQLVRHVRPALVSVQSISKYCLSASHGHIHFTDPSIYVIPLEPEESADESILQRIFAAFYVPVLMS